MNFTEGVPLPPQYNGFVETHMTYNFMADQTLNRRLGSHQIPSCLLHARIVKLVKMCRSTASDCLLFMSGRRNFYMYLHPFYNEYCLLYFLSKPIHSVITILTMLKSTRSSSTQFIDRSKLSATFKKITDCTK